MQAGYARVDYTPEPGLELQGQQFRRVAERARDPLCACAVAFRQGDETVTLVTVDSCFFPSNLVTRAQQGFEERTGLPGRRLLVSATHSHVAPYTFVNHWGSSDPAYLDRIVAAVIEAAVQALGRLEPVTVFRAASQLEYLGWNRRTMFADGASQMHGDTRRPDFIGVEGTRDTTLSVLYTPGEFGHLLRKLAKYHAVARSHLQAAHFRAFLCGTGRGFVRHGCLHDQTLVDYSSRSHSRTRSATTGRWAVYARLLQ